MFPVSAWRSEVSAALKAGRSLTLDNGAASARGIYPWGEAISPRLRDALVLVLVRRRALAQQVFVLHFLAED